MAQGPIIQYDAHVVSPGYNLVIHHLSNGVYATYDDFPTDASGIAAHCSLYITYDNVQWTINNDSSITVTGNISGGILERTATGVASSQSQLITASFNGQQTFQQTVSTASSGYYNLNIPSTFSVTVPPSSNPQPAYPASIDFVNDNTTSQNPPDALYIGMIITNPNPPDYRPGAILNGSSQWLSHNRTDGESHILTSGGTWREMRTVDGLASAGDPPSIRYQDKWMNQRKIGKE